MKRKLLMLLCLIMICCSVSGCAMVDKAKAALNNVKIDAQTESTKNSLMDLINSGNLSSSKKSAEGYLAALSGVQEAIATGENLNFFQRLGLGHPFNKTAASQANIAKANAAATKAELNFNMALGNDDVYKGSVSDANDSGNNQKKGLKADIGVIIIIIVVLLMIILFIFLRKRSNKPSARVGAPKKSGYEITSHAVNAKANKMNACKSLAQKIGVDVNEELAKAGGDVDALYMNLVRMQPLEENDEE